ncbi:MAG: hypothetical protein IAG10_05035 [Planctomycetaceae bacterium]|nr:hypothetical protein [Planctomycetaceae bacterium]
MLLSFFGSQPKSMANFVESFYLAVAIPVAAFGRVLLGNGEKQFAQSWRLLLMLCGIAVALYFLVPTLPE